MKSDDMVQARGGSLGRLAGSGLLLAFLGYTSWSISDACSKALAGRLNPFEVAFSGGVFGLLILPFIRRPGESWLDILPRKQRGLWLLRAGAVFVSTASSVEAFMLLPMPEAMALMFLMPFFVTILSVLFLREKVSAQAWLSVAIGFIGVHVVLRPGLRALHFGHLCAILSAVSNATSVIAYRLSGPLNPRLSLFASSLFGPLVGDGLLMLGQSHWPHGVEDWSLLFGYGFLAALGQLLMIYATSLIPASRVALPQYSQMLWGVAFSYLFFDQRQDVWSFLGIAIIMLSGILGRLRREFRFEKARRKPARDT